MGNTAMQIEITEDGKFPKARHIFCLMGCLGFALTYAMRLNLSVAIVAMVNQTAISQRTPKQTDDTCPVTKLTENITKPEKNGEFLWNEKTQGIVLGSMSYGYIITPIPGGRMAEIFGGKIIFGMGILISAICTLATPIAARWNVTSVIFLRAVLGLAEGVAYPSMHAMIPYWFPPLERSKATSFIYLGSYIGMVISLILTGWLCTLDFLDGWPLSFYVIGFLGIIWYCFWTSLIYNRPSTHPRISQAERMYLEQEIGLSLINYESKTKNVPWIAILTSLPLWAIIVAQCGCVWFYHTFSSELPTYMKQILHVDIETAAIVTAAPFVTMWILGILCSNLANWMLTKNYVSLLNSFRIWATASSVIPSLGLIGIALVGCNEKLFIFLIVFLFGFHGGIYFSHQLNYAALSPVYAGTISGISASIANVFGFVCPYVIGTLINEHETLKQWGIVFYSIAAIYIGSNIFYLLFASTEEQRW